MKHTRKNKTRAPKRRTCDAKRCPYCSDNRLHARRRAMPVAG